MSALTKYNAGFEKKISLDIRPDPVSVFSFY